MTVPPYRVGLLATHPVQYYAPWYRALASRVDLHVFFSHQQTADGQANAGYGVPFEWDVPLVDGYASTFLRNVARRPDVNTFWGCNTPEISATIARARFDAFIVHGWSTRSYWQAMQACWVTGTPILVRGDSSLTTPRAWWWRALKEPVFRAFISRFDGYLVVGSHAREYVQHYGARADRCFDAPHSVDNAFFAQRAAGLRPDRTAVRRAFSLPDAGPVFLFAGRFVERKRADLFVRAIADAAKACPGITGLLVGDGPLRTEIEALARSLSAPVRFSGFLNQTAMVRAYVAADVLVVPSTWETWGLIVNEAMACGIPAIVTEGVACAGDLVVNDDTGSVVPVGSLEPLVERIVALARDDDRRRTLAERAVAHVRRFDVTVAAAGTVAGIAAVASQRRRERAPARSGESHGVRAHE